MDEGLQDLVSQKLTTTSWYLSQIKSLLDRGFHGKITLHIQTGNVERLVTEESILAPQEVRSGNGKKNTQD